MPGSSEVEQTPVKRKVAGSIPALADVVTKEKIGGKMQANEKRSYTKRLRHQLESQGIHPNIQEKILLGMGDKDIKFKLSKGVIDRINKRLGTPGTRVIVVRGKKAVQIFSPEGYAQMVKNGNDRARKMHNVNPVPMVDDVVKLQLVCQSSAVSA